MSSSLEVPCKIRSWLRNRRGGSTSLRNFVKRPRLPCKQGPSDLMYHQKEKKRKSQLFARVFSFSSLLHHQRILLDPPHREGLSQSSRHLLGDIKSMASPELPRPSGRMRGPQAKIPSRIINKLKRERKTPPHHHHPSIPIPTIFARKI